MEAGKRRLAGDIVRQALPRVSSVEGALILSIVLSRSRSYASQRHLGLSRAVRTGRRREHAVTRRNPA